MSLVRWLFAVFIFTTPLLSHALYTELGVSYSRKKTTFDVNNNVDTESTTGSISFYVAERIALELSYTEATSVRNVLVGTDKQVELQTTQVAGSDLIFIFAGKQSFLQPYVKGGAAQIKRQQTIKVNSLQTYTIEPEIAVVPSYGVGLKIALTEQLGIKISYDVWQTPVGNGQKTDDTNLRAGVSWIF